MQRGRVEVLKELRITLFQSEFVDLGRNLEQFQRQLSINLLGLFEVTFAARGKFCVDLLLDEGAQ